MYTAQNELEEIKYVTVNNEILQASEPIHFPASFFGPVDDFGDPFMKPPVHDSSKDLCNNGSVSTVNPLVHDSCGDVRNNGSGSTVSPVHGNASAPASRSNKRKTEAKKKVVCIPIEEAVEGSSKSNNGEFVVPSDPWSWRKYGRKPIKGSPYPRGYYKCSSSKICTAQKQVERSQTDPNTIVVTYISEHNHPKPTKKNPNPLKKKKMELSNLTDSTSREGNTVISSSLVRENRLEIEKVTSSSNDDVHVLDQLFENFDYDPILDALDQWDSFM